MSLLLLLLSQQVLGLVLVLSLLIPWSQPLPFTLIASHHHNHHQHTSMPHSRARVLTTTSRLLQVQGGLHERHVNIINAMHASNSNEYANENTHNVNVNTDHHEHDHNINTHQYAYRYKHDKHFHEYQQVMNKVFSSFRIMQKKDKIYDLEIAKQYLLSPLRYVSNDNDIDNDIHYNVSYNHSHNSVGTLEEDNYNNNNNNDDERNARNEFQKKLQHQRLLFIQNSQHQQLDANNNHITPKQAEIITRSLTYIGDYCAKHLQQTSYIPLLIAWEKIVESAIKPRINCLSTYLYILSTSSSTSSSSTNNNDSNNTSHDIDDVINQVAYYHDMLYSPTENTLAIRIKSFITKCQPQQAEDLLWNVIHNNNNKNNDNNSSSSSTDDNHIKLRLRTCFPILQYYCECQINQTTTTNLNNKQNNDKHISSALTLFHKMKNIPSIHLDKETYTMLISAIAKNGYFCHSSSPISAASQLGYRYSPGYGPMLFDQLAEVMSQDILELCDDCVNQIRNAFVIGFQNTNSSSSNNSNMIRNLHFVPYDCHLSSVQTPAQDDELVVNRVTINEETSICPRTNAKLRLIILDDDQRKHMHDTLLRMADLQFEAYDAKLEAKGQKSTKQNNSNGSNPTGEHYAAKHLDSFATWLE